MPQRSPQTGGDHARRRPSGRRSRMPSSPHGAPEPPTRGPTSKPMRRRRAAWGQPTHRHLGRPRQPIRTDALGPAIAGEHAPGPRRRDPSQSSRAATSRRTAKGRRSKHLEKIKRQPDHWVSHSLGLTELEPEQDRQGVGRRHGPALEPAVVSLSLFILLSPFNCTLFILISIFLLLFILHVYVSQSVSVS